MVCTDGIMATVIISNEIRCLRPFQITTEFRDFFNGTNILKSEVNNRCLIN